MAQGQQFLNQSQWVDASRDFDAMAAAVPDAVVDAMFASGTPAQVKAKLKEFSRHIDHVIVYPASFGMTSERARQVVAGVLNAGAPHIDNQML